ncbi:hypothetical protein OXX79_011113 [Metschnikowia pulcherrima]
MILIDNVKFSCSECIRGHRSTSCRHHMRPLLQVRAKGRPNPLFPYGNKNYRIAVFAQEIDEESQSEESQCKTTPVVILKASDKQVIDLTSGQIMGPYDEVNRKKQTTPVIGPEDFVNTSGCCSPGVSKVTKNCKCNQKKVSRQKILRSFINKRMTNPMVSRQATVSSNSDTPSKDLVSSQDLKSPSRLSPKEKSLGTSVSEDLISMCGSQVGQKVMSSNSMAPSSKSCCSNKPAAPTPHVPRTESNYDMLQFAQSPQPTTEVLPRIADNKHPGSSVFSNQNESQTSSRSGSGNDQGIFQVISVPSCSIPGTCSCSSDCSCASCIVHNNASVKPEDSFSFLNNDSQYESNLILKSESHRYQTERFARELPRDFGQYSSYLAHFAGYDTNPPLFLSELQSELQTAQHESTEQQLANEFQPDLSPCACADDDCFCTNCETHGIIDGYKLDEIFNTQPIITNAFFQG